MESARFSSSGNPATGGGGRPRGGDRGRGRGGFRGRGRGREAHAQFAERGPPRGEDIRNATGSAEAQKREPKPPLTHFLALPIGHHALLRERITAFTTALMQASPPIPGLDTSIVISPRRLHLTLGVMSLTGAPPSSSSERPRTLEAARALLNEIRPDILALLNGEPLRVALNSMDIMPPERGNPERAHVMWVGPAHGTGEFQRLKTVADFIDRKFREAGLLVDEGRPLKLHCTVLNTVYRRPRPKTRMPFSYAAVLASPALRAISMSASPHALPAPCAPAQSPQHSAPSAASSSMQEGRARRQGPVEVDLGVWSVDEVQICEMGSWGPEGEYVCAGKISLV